jgi:hypothetical protein
MESVTAYRGDRVTNWHLPIVRAIEADPEHALPFDFRQLVSLLIRFGWWRIEINAMRFLVPVPLFAG